MCEVTAPFPTALSSGNRHSLTDWCLTGTEPGKSGAVTASPTPVTLISTLTPPGDIQPGCPREPPIHFSDGSPTGHREGCPGPQAAGTLRTEDAPALRSLCPALWWLPQSHCHFLPRPLKSCERPRPGRPWVPHRLPPAGSGLCKWPGQGWGVEGEE